MVTPHIDTRYSAQLQYPCAAFGFSRAAYARYSEHRELQSVWSVSRGGA